MLRTWGGQKWDGVVGDGGSEVCGAPDRCFLQISQGFEFGIGGSGSTFVSAAN